MGIANGQDFAEFFRRQDYQVKKYNSKTVWLEVKNRSEHLEILKDELKNFNVHHDINAKGSSIGALVVNGVKVYLKEKDRADVMQAENVAMQNLAGQIDSIIAQAGKDFSIVLDNGRELVNPTAVKSTSGHPKSDFYIVGEEDDELHISHKKGSSPRHFQQWSGVAESSISTNYYVQNFQREMQRRYAELKPTESIAMRIPDDKDGTELKLMSVYGVDSVNSEIKSGRNKVDCLLQGTPKLEKVSENKYRLTTDVDKVHSFPSLPTGNYEPVLSLVYKGDRSNLGIKYARASIYPADGRHFKEVIG